MNRKYNPWVSLVALLLLALIVVHVCTGCAVQAEEAEKTHRFSAEMHRVEILDAIYIITDNETGVQYIFADGYQNGGLCKLEG